MKQFTFQIITYGCKVNQYESQSIREFWISLDGREIFQAEEKNSKEQGSLEKEIPDIILLSGCAVTAEGVSDARQMTRKLLRNYPNTKVIVTGCAASAEPQDFIFDNVIACIDQTAKWNLLFHHPLELETKFPKGTLFEKKEREYPEFSIKSFERSRPVLKIQDGCSHGCSYCIVPLTRGVARSRPVRESLAEFSRLLDAGFREIVVSGINLRQYSADKENFWGFLRALHKHFIENHEDLQSCVRIRLSSLEPSQINNEALETFEALSSNAFLCPHIHLSLQSGSASVLKRMEREHYAPEKILETLAKLKHFWKIFALGADFLMGFPQESEFELRETITLIETLPFSYAHVFPYSIRPKTKAALLDGHLEKKIRQEHARQVRECIEKKKEEFLIKMLDLECMHVSFDISHTQKITFSHPEKALIGWNEFYVSCILQQRKKSNIFSRELLKVKPKKILGEKLVTDEI